MKFVMHYRAPFTKQLALLDAVRTGAAVHGIEVIGQPGFKGVVPDVDGLIICGIGGMSRDIYSAYWNCGRRIIFFDKGYMRGAYLRVAIDAFQPLDKLYLVERSTDRFEKLALNPQPYKIRGDKILFDGASNKFCLWKGLGDWQIWGKDVAEQMMHATVYPVVYRPRPSHNNALTKFEFDRVSVSLGRMLEDDFAQTRVCVSYGGNIGWDCALAGVSHFAIGDSIARPISETNWYKLDVPLIPSEEDRLQWFANVCYWQWTLQELASGEAWKYIKENLNA